jgi:hypothetical protein
VIAVAIRAALAAALASGCAAGPIKGRLTLPDQPAEPATISYESSLLGKRGELWTTLSTGERFHGAYLLDAGAPDRTLVSTLDGDRGNSLTCRLTLKEPGVGPHGGGTARCELSSGGTFEASF